MPELISRSRLRSWGYALRTTNPPRTDPSTPSRAGSSSPGPRCCP
ncbi:hypothetical protein I553_2061 [Mycobacterium xenopi 4042]|uniref:Uncharacterized protein n=1 Tax=Mycobacterium xenopi 4042 TaxID=1299334 RepID=X8DMF3_MYCXE|nr:hypothetical protein I553_2061 [Mycobacterium xenopi 4042]